MKRGFTLIELAVIMVIVGFLAFVFAIYMREGINAWQFLSGQKNITLSSRAALNRVVRELRRIRQNTNITTHTSQEITFIDVDNESVTFSQSGSNLMRGSEVLLANLQDPCGLTFTYLDETGNPTDIPNEMRIIRCRLIVVKNENRFVLESAARIAVRKIK